MFCNNVSALCLHVIVTDYVLIGEIAGNKHPVFIIIILISRSDIDREWRLGCGDGAYNAIRMEILEESILGVLCGRRISLMVKGKVVPYYIQDGCKTSNDVRSPGHAPLAEESSRWLRHF